MFLLGKVATPQQKAHFLEPLLEGRVRSAFLMTEPAEDNGAGSDPSMLRTSAEPDGEHWSSTAASASVPGSSAPRSAS